jgi:hypothetical protein
MVEVMVVVMLLVIGLGGMVLGFVGSQKLTHSAQRDSQGASIAESDLESIVGRPYADIALTSLPSHASDSNANDPTDPRYYVNPASGTGTSFMALENYYDAGAGSLPEAPSGGETLVPASTNGVAQSCTLGSGGTCPSPLNGSGVPSGTIYRFITWRNEKCSAVTLPGSIDTLIKNVVALISPTLADTLFGSGNSNPPGKTFCSSPNNEKRITDAVVLSKPGNGAVPLKPVYVSTIVPDPNAAVPPDPSNCTGLVALFCG